MCGESSLSVEGLHVDLQLSRSTCQFHRHSVTCSSTALTGFLDMTERSLKCITQQQVSGNLLFFSTCASFLRRWIVHSPLFVFFLLIFAVFGQRLKWQSSHPTNVVRIPSSQTDESSRHPWVLVDLAAAESATLSEDRFQRRRPTQLTLSCTLSARSSRHSTALELSGQ